MAGNRNGVRTLEEVEHMINLAKLEDADLKYITQSVRISDVFQSDGMKLMEVDSLLLNELLNGKSLVIRGDKNDPAVICNENKTYEMKEAETSNSLLLLPEWKWPDDINNDRNERILCMQNVTGIFHTYFELRPGRPKFKKLRTLLEENPYQGHEYEKENVGKKYTFDELLNTIQASSDELEKALHDIQAYFIDGYWRLLDFEYQTRVFSFILTLVDSNSWSVNEVPELHLLDTLQDLVPRDILKQCLHWFADCTETKNNDGDKYFKLNEEKICRFYAEILLRPTKKFNLEEFLECWQKCVPEGMTTSLSQLEGLALVDCASRPNAIHYYPVCDLPEDINDRFFQLFKIRNKWTSEEIYPYIIDLCTANQDVNVLLTKYARASIHKGIKMYSSKQPSS